MNKSIITLSSISVLLMTNNAVINNVCANTAVNTLTSKSLVNENPISLINNQYGYLGDGDWITNQSIIDHKFYSYDTATLKNYTFTNARYVFFVNEKGELSDNENVIIPNQEKLNIANTKQEMIKRRKVTAIKDDYNPYSKSEYDNSYFAGDNSDWQYLQFGGIEKHINITGQWGADKIENNSNLSETLGLYYVAKAVQENKISKAIADNLGQYFLDQSTLKTKINNSDVISKIISIIANNSHVFQLVSQLSSTNNDINYGIIYIFDNENNLIKVNYQKFANNNIEKNVNYNFDTWYSGFNSQNEDASNTYTLLKWSDYVKDWDTFTRVFATFSFDKSSFLKVSASYGETNWANLISETKNIKSYQGNDNNNVIFTVAIDWGGWYIGNHIKIQFNIWHDNNNIYYKWFLQEDAHWGYNLYVNICLNKVLFQI